MHYNYFDGVNTYDASILYEKDTNNSDLINEMINQFNETNEFFEASIMLDKHLDLLRFGKFQIQGRRGRSIYTHMCSGAVPDNNRKREVSIVVIDKKTGLIANYFCLRLLTEGVALNLVKKPLIELRYFLNNTEYRNSETAKSVPMIGKYVFTELIRPMMVQCCNKANTDTIFVMSVNKRKLVKHYVALGFSKVHGVKGVLYSALLKSRYTRKCKLLMMKI